MSAASLAARQSFRAMALALPLALGLGAFTPATPAQETAAPASRLDGVIVGADDQPLSNAWVSVFSAAPRDGQRSTIPIKNYPECGRHVRTDAQGQFVFTGLNPDRLYRLLAGAPGHRPDYLRDADPQFGGMLLKLRPLRVTNAPASRRIIGTLIDPRGQPVPGARIEVNGLRNASSSYTTSLGNAVDSLAVSDESGRFVFDCASSVEAVSVTIEAPRLAWRRQWLTPGSAHLIRLHTGTTVTGRLIESGKPVAGTLITMETENRESDVVLSGFDVATDAEGRFTLTHVPAETAFRLHSPPRELEALNAGLSPRQVTTGTNGSTLALGDLPLDPAFVLRGRVLLSDGQPVPNRTRITLGLPSNNSRSATLDADGWFEFLGVPGGNISLNVNVSGYRISAKNPNKDWLNSNRLVGRMQENHERFFIELEPSKTPAPAAPAKSQDRQPTDKRLQGAPIDG